MKLIIPIRDIPLGSAVTKVGGTKPYIVRDCVKIYGDSDANRQREIRADDGTRFLVSDTGDITVVAGDTEHLWIVSDHNLYEYLTDQIVGRRL